jgi:hypothetical protein
LPAPLAALHCYICVLHSSKHMLQFGLGGNARTGVPYCQGQWGHRDSSPAGAAGLEAVAGSNPVNRDGRGSLRRLDPVQVVIEPPEPVDLCLGTPTGWHCAAFHRPNGSTNSYLGLQGALLDPNDSDDRDATTVGCPRLPHQLPIRPIHGGIQIGATAVRIQRNVRVRHRSGHQ